MSRLLLNLLQYTQSTIITHAEDIEMDQHFVITTTKATDKVSGFGSSQSAIKNDVIVVNCEDIHILEEKEIKKVFHIF